MLTISSCSVTAYCVDRELQSKVKAGKVEPEVAMLNAAVVSSYFCCT